jgi:hypothetical protein
VEEICGMLGVGRSTLYRYLGQDGHKRDGKDRVPTGALGESSSGFARWGAVTDSETRAPKARDGGLEIAFKLDYNIRL